MDIICGPQNVKHSKIKSIPNKNEVKKIRKSKYKSLTCFHFFSLVKVFSLVNISLKKRSPTCSTVSRREAFLNLFNMQIWPFLIKTKGLFNTCFESIQ